VHFAAAEQWREKMLRDDGAVSAFASEYAGVDGATLAALVRDARAERSRGGPPHRYRELFRTIKAAVDGETNG
jgi:ribosome-associated protein